MAKKRIRATEEQATALGFEPNRSGKYRLDSEQEAELMQLKAMSGTPQPFVGTI